jgi:hypothetical protein
MVDNSYSVFLLFPSDAYFTPHYALHISVSPVMQPRNQTNSAWNEKIQTENLKDHGQLKTHCCRMVPKIIEGLISTNEAVIK